MKAVLNEEEFLLYLRALGIPPQLNLSNSVETLYLLSNKQFIYIHYQNIDLHLKEKTPKTLTIQALIKRLCVDKVGGLCYEQELLLYYVLKHLNFDVHPVRCQVREPGAIYNPQQPYTHDLLIVNIDQQQYIVDPGFGFRSLRYPLRVDFTNLPSSCEFMTLENFRINQNDTHYQLEQLIDNTWVSYYDFEKPLNFGNVKQTERDYMNLFTYPKFLGARDSRFVISKNVENGKIYYMWFRLEKKFTAFRKIISEFQVEKKDFQNFEEMRIDIQHRLSIMLPDYDQF